MSSLRILGTSRAAEPRRPDLASSRPRALDTANFPETLDSAVNVSSSDRRGAAEPAAVSYSDRAEHDANETKAATTPSDDPADGTPRAATRAKTAAGGHSSRNRKTREVADSDILGFFSPDVVIGSQTGGPLRAVASAATGAAAGTGEKADRTAVGTQLDRAHHVAGLPQVADDQNCSLSAGQQGTAVRPSADSEGGGDWTGVGSSNSARNPAFSETSADYVDPGAGSVTGQQDANAPAGDADQPAGWASASMIPESARDAGAAQQRAVEHTNFTVAAGANPASVPPPALHGELSAGHLRLDPETLAGALVAVSKAGARDAPDSTGLRVAIGKSQDNARDKFAGTEAAAGVASTATAPGDGLAVQNGAGASGGGRSPNELPDQLFGCVTGSIGNPGREVVLHLHPPELGDVTVRVLVSGREVSAWFATPQLQVQQLIGQAIGQLRADLGNAGYNLAGAWVGADASSPREQNGYSAPPRAPAAIAAAEPAAPAAASNRVARPGVSIYV